MIILRYCKNCKCCNGNNEFYACTIYKDNPINGTPLSEMCYQKNRPDKQLIEYYIINYKMNWNDKETCKILSDLFEESFCKKYKFLSMIESS